MAADRTAVGGATNGMESAGTARHDAIDDFVARRLAGLPQRLPVDAQEPLDPAVMAEVQFLKDLSLLRRQHVQPAAGSPSRRRLLMPAMFAATALVVGAMIFLRLPAIRIEADILCSGLTFRTGSPIQLTGLSRITLLQASEFAPLDVEDITTARPVGLTSPLELSPTETGSLTLSSITIPSDAVVSIHGTPDRGSWRVSIEHREAVIGATASGLVNVAAGGSVARTVGFGRGSLISLTAAPPASRLDVHVTPERIDSLLAGRVIPVTGVIFEETVQQALPGSFNVTRGHASSILSGSVFNISLGGREWALRRQDTVAIDLDTADVRELRLEPEGVRINMSGIARELQLGRTGGLQTLRPSYLEWLAEHHALKAAWGAAAWLFALFLGGLKWWHDFAT